jgi:hypothetical protein
MVEGGTVPRAKVMDQTVIDRYLMRGEITINQYRAGEHLLSQYSKSSIRGANLKGSGGGAPGSVVPFGAVPFGRSLRCIQDQFGWTHMWITKAAIADNRDVARIGEGMGMECLRQSLDYIGNTKLGGDPLQRLRRKAS